MLIRFACTNVNLVDFLRPTAKTGGAPAAAVSTVADGVTGVLVPVQLQDNILAEPVDPERFSRDLATQIDRLMAEPALREKMGKSGRKRVSELFSWDNVAHRTLELYKSL